jgi:homoserine O-succinyltransferase
MPPKFPESLITPTLDNTWHDTAEAILSNWVGKIYQITHTDRRLPFMLDIDPDNPLNL